MQLLRLKSISARRINRTSQCGISSRESYPYPFDREDLSFLELRDVSALQLRMQNVEPKTTAPTSEFQLTADHSRKNHRAKKNRLTFAENELTKRSLNA